MLGLGAPFMTLWLSIAGALIAAVALLPLLYFMSEGLTPAYVLAARRRGWSIEEVSLLQALSAYVLATGVLGVVFGVAYLLVAATGIAWLIPSVAAAATVTSVAYFLFTRLALPDADLELRRARLLKIQLLSTAFLYGLVLMVLVPSLALGV
ncbi:hypothetical protein [Natranaeroarchaeum aerophilus]|uniref:Uncharacterized protein n=1 Tax=Natranaeroarchaeum aerophilus TaxID=2917711 RepID=A0AAE3FS29_9EURY|nr:hypothetical protein [Natranaeroarchaeum aerophilus]MCL9814080.1 hypothetical protein [Natranaeroarchaeum aerophilus]